MIVQTGEIYGKRRAGKLSMYNVLKVTKKSVTLQNIDNPLSLFETTADKLQQSGYERISETPFIDTRRQNKKRANLRPNRCPYTMDFLAGRADCDKPQTLASELF
ncbi:MAG: hypothetical protein LBV44_02545 [Methylobacillus sp.]|jgi:hypothetical protein|nr:hypothetical protein [Methylobacillus sp.]